MAARTHDVLAFRGATPRGVARLDQSLGDATVPGQLCTGVQKLAQWWVVEFMTERGSRPYDPEGGTRFLTDLRRGRLRNEAAVFVAFGFAAGDIKARAAAIEDPAAPADERLADASLDRVEIAAGTVKLHVTLTTRAGSTREVILPVSSLPA